MRLRRGRSDVVAFAALAVGAGVLLGLADWPQPHRTFEFSALILAAILTHALAMRQSITQDWATMPLSFVVDFTSLLLLGPNATMLVVTAGTVTQGLTDSEQSTPPRGMLLNVVTAVVATQAAGVVHQALGGTRGHFMWPGQGVPIAAAVVGYCLVKSALADIIVPLFTRQAVNRSWLKSNLRGCPNYCIGASLAVGLVEVIDRGNWQVVPAAAIPLFFAYRAYCAHVDRLEEEHRRREVIDSLEQGMSVIDRNGRITLWNDALERILGCPSERALGRSLVGAVPDLGKTNLTYAINDALTNRKPRTLTHLALPAAAGARILQVKIVPVAGGVTLLWHDVTERTRLEEALRRNADRLTLAAEGANDGLWEWDLRSREFYFSGRWGSMIGLPAPGIGRPEEWTDRVHADDIVPLTQAIEAHLSGKTEHFQHEHRIRH